MDTFRKTLAKTLGATRSDLPPGPLEMKFLEDRLANASRQEMQGFLEKCESIFLYEVRNRKRHVRALERVTERAENLLKDLEEAHEEKASALEELHKLVSPTGEGKELKSADLPRLVSMVAELTGAQKQHNSEVNEARLEALGAAKARSRFLANMSHEIRTPMNGIIGTLNLFADTPLDAEQQQHLDVILRSTKALLRVLNDILDFSKIQDGRMELEETPIRLLDTCRDILNTFGVAAANKDILIHLEYDEELPTRVLGDEARIRQILNNLVGNAVKFTAEGEVTLRVTPLHKDTLSFEVIDTGIGMNSEAMEKLFQPFCQGDGSITRKFGGTGLGLSISKDLAGLMGGSISVTSNPKHGSTFKLTLSLPPVHENVEPTNEQPEEIESNPFKKLIGKGSPLKILVAEDNQINQTVAMQTLQKIGHEVEIANNGLEALEMVQAGDFDTILMDLEMPEMGGLESAQRIRQLPGSKGETRIIAMTGHALDDNRRQCMDAGMDGFIPKPFDLFELSEALQGGSQNLAPLT